MKNIRFCNLKKIVIFILLFGFNSIFSQVSITSVGTAFTQNFDGIGNTATAILPKGFRIVTNWNSEVAIATTQVTGTSYARILNCSSAGCFYSFEDGNQQSEIIKYTIH